MVVLMMDEKDDLSGSDDESQVPLCAIVLSGELSLILPSSSQPRVTLFCLST